jgi:hypothetical protein
MVAWALVDMVDRLVVMAVLDRDLVDRAEKGNG